MKEKNRRICSTDNCGMSVHCRDLCGACYQWCRKFELRNRTEQKHYLERFEYRMHRMLARIGLRSGGKVLSFRKSA